MGRGVIRDEHKDNSCVYRSTKVLLKGAREETSRRRGQVTMVLACVSACVFPVVIQRVRGGIARTNKVLRVTVASGSMTGRQVRLRRFLEAEEVSKLVTRPIGDKLPGPGLSLCRGLRGSKVPILFIGDFCRGLAVPRIDLSSRGTNCVTAGRLLRYKRAEVTKVFGTSSKRKEVQCTKCAGTLVRRSRGVGGQRVL